MHNFLKRTCYFARLMIRFTNVIISNSAESAVPHCVDLIVCILQEDGDPPVNESLSIENTLWASTVIASGE